MTPLAAALLGVAAGLVVGVLLAWRSLRPRAGQADAAEVARARLHAVVDNLRAVVVVLEPDQTVAVSSRLARTSGLVRSTRLASDDVARVARAVAATGEPAAVEAEPGRGPGSHRILLGLDLVPLGHGAVLITGEDRSADLRFTETRRDFVANITHELKTPIGAILLLSEAIEAASDDPEAVRGFVTRLDAETRRLNELVSHILALSRLQSEDPLLAADPVEIDAVVAASLQRCRAQAAAGRITLATGGDSGLSVLGDAGQLETAVTNLVQNAIAYSEPGGRVVVSARPGSADTVELKVSDTGIGISEADLERIFERFYRVDPGRSRANGGTGLGLSIVKHVAVAHGGEVTAWSRPGQGSTFTLRLPLYAPERETA
jgi:two-component system sensor histidine kinase SenX3